jgi:hypothetical protein
MKGCQMGFRVAIGLEIVRRCFPSLHGIQRKREKEELEKGPWKYLQTGQTTF